MDDWLAFEWALTRKSLGVKIHNKAAETLNIAWDRAKFVSFEGTEHRLVDRYVKHKNREFPKPPTALKPGTEFLQSLYPADYLGWEGEKIIDWRCRSLLPEMAGLASANPEPVRQFGRAQLGKSVSIVVPVRGPSGSREYRFTFTVIRFTVRRIIAG